MCFACLFCTLCTCKDQIMCMVTLLDFLWNKYCQCLKHGIILVLKRFNHQVKQYLKKMGFRTWVVWIKHNNYESKISPSSTDQFLADPIINIIDQDLKHKDVNELSLSRHAICQFTPNMHCTHMTSCVSRRSFNMLG